MKKLLTITLMLFCFMSADEFFEPKTTIGGYGEMHYDMEANNGDGKLDFHRFIIYYKHQFSPKWSMMSEVEIEHNMIYTNDNAVDAIRNSFPKFCHINPYKSKLKPMKMRGINMI